MGVCGLSSPLLSSATCWSEGGLCLCVLVWSGGIIIRGDDEPRKDLRCCAVLGIPLPASNLEGNRGEAVDLFFCLAVPCSSKHMLLSLRETQATGS